MPKLPDYGYVVSEKKISIYVNNFPLCKQTSQTWIPYIKESFVVNVDWYDMIIRSVVPEKNNSDFDNAVLLVSPLWERLNDICAILGLKLDLLF